MYLLDSNTYIEAKNRYYQLDFCPAYWQFLEQSCDIGVLASIRAVYDEIGAGTDELADWAKNHQHHFAPNEANEIQAKYSQVVRHVIALPNASSNNKNKFLRGADPWLIAAAIPLGATVVTHELPMQGNSTKVTIPDVCNHFGVDYTNTFQMLKNLNARFVLQ